MEFSNCVWSPIKKKYIDQIESVQRRATKLISSLRNLSYPERLKQLSLPSLTYRRARGDMIEVFKIISNIYDARVCNFFTLRENTRTRGSKTRKILHCHCSTSVRHHFFCVRICKLWNDLPDEIVEAATLNSFKNRLDKYWQNRAFRFHYEVNPYCMI